MRLRPCFQTNALGLLVLSASFVLWVRAASAIDWLVFVVDRSNSISTPEYKLEHDAHVSVLSDPAILAMLGGAKVAIVEFDTAAEVVVNWTSPRAAASTYRLHAPPERGRLTGVGRALLTALDLLHGKPGQRVIDISGDGRENVDFPALQRARERAIRDSVDINGLVILSPEAYKVDEYYESYVATGFVVTVRKWQDFLAALRRKLVLEIALAHPVDPTD
jgi:hypothetical protein